MKKGCNPRNERVKRQYLEWQREANRRSDSTVRVMASSIARFEKHTAFADFEKLSKEQALSFKKSMLEEPSPVTGQPLRKSTANSVLRQVQDFFKWLISQPGYKKMSPDTIAYMNLSLKEGKMATQQRLRPAPTIEQVRAAINAMPDQNELNKRDRALLAFLAITGVRDGVIPTLKLKHVSLADQLLSQPGDEVNTKFSKTIYTYFFPVGDDLLEVFESWVKYLRTVMLFNEYDPLFPRTRMIVNSDKSFEAAGLDRSSWATAEPVRKIVKEAFERIGCRRFDPHSFRNMLARIGWDLGLEMREMKAWSQNLGHDNMMLTVTTYGQLDQYYQGQIIKEIANKKHGLSIDDVMDFLNKRFGENSQN